MLVLSDGNYQLKTDEEIRAISNLEFSLYLEEYFNQNLNCVQIIENSNLKILISNQNNQNNFTIKKIYILIDKNFFEHI